MVKSKVDPERIDKKLHLAMRIYMAKKGYSVHHEVGLVARGRIRADLWCFTLGLHAAIVEIKSSVQDFRRDEKWQSYSAYANRCYFGVTAALLKQLPDLKDAAKAEGWGILVLEESGLVKCRVKSVSRDDVPMKLIKPIVVKLAYRAGNHRRNTRRQKVIV